MLRKTFQQQSSQANNLFLAGRVLVIDTDPFDLERHAELLRSLGHEVVSCPSYREAVRELATKEFDLVIVDQGGYHFEARAVLEHLASTKTHMATIVVTRHRHMLCYVEALGLGAEDYVEKPVSREEMQRLLNKFMPPRVLMTSTRP